MNDSVTLLRAAIASSGLSVAEYARVVLTRHHATVYRWLKGQTPIPQAVRDKLKEGAP